MFCTRRRQGVKNERTATVGGCGGEYNFGGMKKEDDEKQGRMNKKSANWCNNVVMRYTLLAAAKVITKYSGNYI